MKSVIIDNKILLVNNINDFFNLIEKNNLLLVFFSANWCVYCSKLKNNINFLLKNEKIKFPIVEINVDDSPQISNNEMFNIKILPSIFFFNNGKIAKSNIGYLNTNELLSFFEIN